MFRKDRMSKQDLKKLKCHTLIKSECVTKFLWCYDGSVFVTILN